MASNAAETLRLSLMGAATGAASKGPLRPRHAFISFDTRKLDRYVEARRRLACGAWQEEGRYGDCQEKNR